MRQNTIRVVGGSLALLCFGVVIWGCSRPVRTNSAPGPVGPAPQAEPAADLTFADDAAFERWLASTFRTTRPQTPIVNRYYPVPAKNALLGLPFYDADPPWIIKLPGGEVCFAGKAQHGNRRDVVFSPPSNTGLLVCRWLDPDARAYFAAIGRIEPDAETPFRFGAPQVVPLNGLEDDESDVADWDDATFSHDGRLMLRYKMGHGTACYAIDAETLAWRELGAPAPEHVTYQTFLPGGRLVRHAQWVGEGDERTIQVSVRPYLGFSESGIEVGEPVTTPAGAYAIRAQSPDGKLFVVDHNGDPHLWQLAGTALKPMSVVPPTYKVYSGDNPHFAAGRLAMSRFGDAYVYDVGADGKVTGAAFLHKSAFKESCRACVLADDARMLFVIDFDDYLHAIDLATLNKSARIGQDLIRWQTPTANTRATTWPNVHLRADWSRTGDTLELDIVARNNGPEDALRVAAEIDWESESGACGRCGTIYFGTIAARSEVRRRARFSAGTKAGDLCLYRALARVLGEFPVTPATWLQAPNGVDANTTRRRAEAAFGALEAPQLKLEAFIPDSEAYHARVKEVFEAGYEILAELTGRRPKCTCTEIGLGIGFMCAGQDIRYQNPFQFNENDWRVNRSVIHTSDPVEVAAHAQMMPYWFIPHELVHAFDNRSGDWNSEYVANTIQPWLTERILQRIQSPFDAATMRKVYDRYIAVLRRTITRAEAEAIHTFATGDGSGQPFEQEARYLFFDRTPLYVYFGAVVNRHSLNQATTLEQLVAKYLKP